VFKAPQDPTVIPPPNYLSAAPSSSTSGDPEQSDAVDSNQRIGFGFFDIRGSSEGQAAPAQLTIEKSSSSFAGSTIAAAPDPPSGQSSFYSSMTSGGAFVAPLATVPAPPFGGNSTGVGAGIGIGQGMFSSSGATSTSTGDEGVSSGAFGGGYGGGSNGCMALVGFNVGHLLAKPPKFGCQPDR